MTVNHAVPRPQRVDRACQEFECRLSPPLFWVSGRRRLDYRLQLRSLQRVRFGVGVFVAAERSVSNGCQCNLKLRSRHHYATHVLVLSRPGKSGDSVPWEGWSHVREYVEEVPGRAA